MAKGKIPSLEKLNEWINTRQYRKVITAVEAAAPAQRSVDHIVRLCMAYNLTADPGTPEGRQLLQKAVDLLEPTRSQADNLRDPFSWYFTMGTSLVLLDREAEALPYAQKAYDLNPDSNAQPVLHLCQWAVQRPKARWSFREGAEKAWDAFTQRQPEILEQLAKEQIGRCSETLEHLVSDCMAFAFSRPDVSVWKTEGKPRLVFDIRVSSIGIFQIQALLRQAPAALREDWDFQFGPLPDRQSKEVRRYLRQYGDMPIQLYEDEAGEIVTAKLMGIPFVLTKAQYNALSSIPGYKESLQYVRAILGEIPFYRLCHLYRDEMRPGPEVPLRHLSQTLAEHGVDCSEASAGKVLQPQPYSLPNRTEVKAWRGLEESGEHQYVRLLDSLNDRIDYFSDDTVQDGVEGGYLVWPIQDGFQRKVQAETVQFQKELQSKLLEQLGDTYLTPLGRGTDRYFAYLDFLAWDLQPVLETAADLLQAAGLPWAVYRPYRDMDPATSLFGFPASPLQRH